MQPTSAFLPGKFHGQRSLTGYSPWSHKESDTTERARTHTHTHTPLELPGLITGRVLWMSTFSIGVQGEESGMCELKWEKIHPGWNNFKWFMLYQDNTGTERREKHILIGWGNK